MIVLCENTYIIFNKSSNTKLDGKLESCSKYIRIQIIVLINEH